MEERSEEKVVHSEVYKSNENNVNILYKKCVLIYFVYSTSNFLTLGRLFFNGIESGFGERWRDVDTSILEGKEQMVALRGIRGKTLA